MDEKYEEVAANYGFHCTGCKNNCCRTRFYHYTLSEYLYILKGYNSLPHRQQAEIAERALRVCQKTSEADRRGVDMQPMCPLNFNGLCRLYAYRPMICRMHGIPHQLHRHGRVTAYGSGCAAFKNRCDAKGDVVFDRTPFYIEMAALEKELKLALGFTQKIKLTVAQMLLNQCPQRIRIP
jgi:Fe-S-cluster containining protein